MRKITTIATAIVLMVALSAGVTFAPTTAIVEGISASYYIKGTAEADVIRGLGGDDLFYGDAGHDGLYGGPGNDTLHSMGDGGADYVDRGSGTHTVKKGPDQNPDRFVYCERFVS